MAANISLFYVTSKYYQKKIQSNLNYSCPSSMRSVTFRDAGRMEIRVKKVHAVRVKLTSVTVATVVGHASRRDAAVGHASQRDSRDIKICDLCG